MDFFTISITTNSNLYLSNAFFAEKKKIVDISYPGDIVGLQDTGNFKIGDTLTQGESLRYTGIPVFAPEHFVRVDLRKWFKFSAPGTYVLRGSYYLEVMGIQSWQSLEPCSWTMRSDLSMTKN